MIEKFNSLVDFVREKARLFVVLFFLLFLAAGLLTADDYGVSGDEFFEQRSSNVNFKYIFEDFLQKESDNPGIQRFLDETEALDTFEDRYYGVAMQLPMTFIEYLRHFTLDARYVILSRHYWVFLNFFLAMICFYCFLKDRFENRGWAVFGVFLMILSPKIVAESFYNIKDILFLSWVVISIWFSARFVRRPSVGSAILLALTNAVAGNIRIYGLLLIPVVILYFLFTERGKRPEKDFHNLLIYLFLCAGCYILLSPVLWENPIREFLSSLAVFSSFSHSSDALFFGKTIQANRIWYYLPVYIWISTPLLISTLVLVGFAFLLRAGFTFREKAPRWEYAEIVSAAFLIIPISFQIITHSTVYDGWRHYYFTFPMIVFLAVYAMVSIHRALPEGWKGTTVIRCGLWVCVLCSAGNAVRWYTAAHPLEYLYLNPVMESSSRLFQRDYWGLSHRVVLEDAASMAKEGEKIEITGRNSYYTYNNFLILPKSVRAKLDVYSYSNLFDSDYYILVYQYDSEDEISIPHYRKIKDYEVLGIRYASLYRIDKDGWQEIAVGIDSSETNRNETDLRLAYDGRIDTQWSTEDLTQSGNETLTLRFEKSVQLNRIDMENHLYLGYATSPALYCEKEDGSWESVTLTEPYDHQRLIFAPRTCQGIRIENQTESDRYWTISEFRFYGNILE